ncbi:MAG: hypothetical protein R3336_01175 [Phycisphaeraceae bacterium]|nr:hypothetical protein [Phycisphaeraceae bacterium]
MADPSPPAIDEADLQGTLTQEITELTDQMADQSERDLADTVHRRLTLHLCGDCYREWIEDPAGQ